MPAVLKFLFFGPGDLQEALSLSVPILTVAILAQGTISKPWHHAGLFFFVSRLLPRGLKTLTFSPGKR